MLKQNEPLLTRQHNDTTELYCTNVTNNSYTLPGSLTLNKFWKIVSVKRVEYLTPPHLTHHDIRHHKQNRSQCHNNMASIASFLV